MLPVSGRFQSLGLACFVSGTLAVLGVATTSAYQPTTAQVPSDDPQVIDRTIGKQLPDFSFVDFDGRSRRLSDFSGKYLLLNFWGSWCGPCLGEFKALKLVREQFKDRGFEILGLDYEKYDAPIASVRALLTSLSIEWPNAQPQSVRDLITKRFKVTNYPNSILLDRTGIVVANNVNLDTQLPAILEKALPPR
jgi:thiol-disulfide isomerase/thioredoxin